MAGAQVADAHAARLLHHATHVHVRAELRAGPLRGGGDVGNQPDRVAPRLVREQDRGLQRPGQGRLELARLGAESALRRRARGPVSDSASSVAWCWELCTVSSPLRR